MRSASHYIIYFAFASTTLGYSVSKVANSGINADEAPDLAAKYGVNSIPALFLFKDGKVAAQAVGFMQKPDLKCFVSQ